MDRSFFFLVHLTLESDMIPLYTRSGNFILRFEHKLLVGRRIRAVRWTMRPGPTKTNRDGACDHRAPHAWLSAVHACRYAGPALESPRKPNLAASAQPRSSSVLLEQGYLPVASSNQLESDGLWCPVYYSTSIFESTGQRRPLISLLPLYANISR